MSVGVFVGVHEHVVSGVSGVRVAAALQRSPLALFRLPFVVAEGRSLATASLEFLFCRWDGATMCVPMVAAATSLPSGFGSAAALVG